MLSFISEILDFLVGLIFGNFNNSIRGVENKPCFLKLTHLK